MPPDRAAAFSRTPAGRLAAALLLALFAVPPVCRAAPAPPVESYLADWARSLADEFDLADFEPPSDEELRALGRQFSAFFDTGSYDAIAWILPDAREALALCDAVPDLKPYADWLRQRMDFLELASTLVRLYPPETPLPPLPRRSPTARFSLPRPPPPPPVTAAMLAKREAAARSRNVWRKTLAQRPIPGAGLKLVPLLKSVFESEGLPHQLVWLAEVESSFNPLAKSPAGAEGLFQIMPETAARLGLQLQPVDQRHSPELSARAAARYLRLLHRTFGSWPLALAGYNAGEGRVSRLLKKSGASAYEAVAADLPLETRLYVPKLLTLIELREKTPVSALAPPRPPHP